MLGGAYTNSIVHRSVPDFVIQGGGYSTSLQSLPPPVTEYVIFVIAVPEHLVCAFVPAVEVNEIAALGFTRIDFVAVLTLPFLYAFKVIT